MRFTDRWSQLMASLLEDEALSKRAQYIVLGLVLASCLSVHVATMSVPPLDRTEWKEMDYIYISTNYWKHGFNFLHPEITWSAEPPYVTAMEFPLVPFLAAGIYKVAGFNVYTVRVIPVIAFVLMTLYVFRLIRRESGPVLALVGALASAIMPLYHPFGRFLFSDSTMLAFSVMTLFYFAEWVDKQKRRDWVLACATFTVAIALKLYPLYLLVPMTWLVYRRYPQEAGKYISLLKLTFGALVVSILWYSYAVYLKSHYTDLFYLFDSRKFDTLEMLTSLAWYRTMSLRLTAILAGKSGVPLFLAGVAVALSQKRAQLFLVYMITIGGYFGLMAQSNSGASYYQFPIIPPFSFFVALGGVATVVTAVAAYASIMRSSMTGRDQVILCLVGGILLVSFMAVRRHMDVFARDPMQAVHEEKWQLAEIIKHNFDSNAKLLTVGEYALYSHGRHDLSPVLYYYTGMRGWSLNGKDWSLDAVHSYVQKGANVFVAEQVDKIPELPPFLNVIKPHFKVLLETPSVLILDLRKETP